MKNKKIEDEINAFLEIWDAQQLISFISDIEPLLNLYDIDENNDWVKDIVGAEDERNVRLIRTVYLLSKIAENHSGKLAEIKYSFRNLWMRMERNGLD